MVEWTGISSVFVSWIYSRFGALAGDESAWRVRETLMKAFQKALGILFWVVGSI
jgi:hypothetical protein